MDPLTSLDAIAAAKYISLTTFRKDGRAVATPVWLVRDGQTLRVLTDSGSGKVKRLRNNPDVLVAPCDMRGRIRPGVQSLAGTGTLQNPEETMATMALVTERYGLMGRLLGWRNERRAKKANGGRISHQGLTLTLAP